MDHKAGIIWYQAVQVRIHLGKWDQVVPQVTSILEEWVQVPSKDQWDPVKWDILVHKECRTWCNKEGQGKWVRRIKADRRFKWVRVDHLVISLPI